MEEIGAEISFVKCLLMTQIHYTYHHQGHFHVPHVAVGDDAFLLTTYVMKPFPMSSLTPEQRIFNYRLSRIRRISENVLGIMAQKWQVLRNVMLVGPEKATTIVLAIMTLHNYLCSDQHCMQPGAVDDERGGTEGTWRKEARSTVSWLDLPSLTHDQNYSTKTDKGCCGVKNMPRFLQENVRQESGKDWRCGNTNSCVSQR